MLRASFRPVSYSSLLRVSSLSKLIIASAADSPAVERAGSVMPQTNGPQPAFGLVISDWPEAPFVDVEPQLAPDSATRSRQLGWTSGQPSARPIGSGMATTSGERATGGACAGSSPAPSGRSCATRSQAVDSGDHTSGRGPSWRGSHAGPSASAACEESLRSTLTWTHRPFTFGCPDCHLAAALASTSPWSGEATTVRLTGEPPQ